MADSNNPAPEPSSIIAPLDMEWARDELVPFLQSVFAQPGKSADDWMKSILHARRNIHLIPFYEDFPLTIERLRLTLLNSETLTPKELSKFTKVTELGSQMCIRIFVRHASTQGPYLLFSLGRDPNPDLRRGNQARGSRPARTQPPQLMDENRALQKQMSALNLETEGHHGGRYVQTIRPRQLRGGYEGHPDNGHHFNRGARVSQAVQQPSPQYPPAPFGGYNQPYDDPSMARTPYAPTPSMVGYGMQHYGNPPPQSYSEWNVNQSYHNAQQANSAQPRASSAYPMSPPQVMLVPQQFRVPSRQGQQFQHHRAASAGQQGQVLAQNEDHSVPPLGQASSSRRASSSVLRPEARPFTPGKAI
ncbi:hypothetical protein CUC08_Gglean002842 [Alternaria sp. MG1]|uniref:Uncharacterized protein n=1 Tax=Alternaria tenuissima TaxID=119927 RepID=A0AB37WCL4_9PLEO|nr:hypothetical protein CUC08_Gglean002842 [Alternaria sp. MG1]RYN25865.1 hypothetical protein AA0115_g7322 [Alternaria tenuissima]